MLGDETVLQLFPDHFRWPFSIMGFLANCSSVPLNIARLFDVSLGNFHFFTLNDVTEMGRSLLISRVRNFSALDSFAMLWQITLLQYNFLPLFYGLEIFKHYAFLLWWATLSHFVSVLLQCLVVVLFRPCRYPVPLLQFYRSYPSRFRIVLCEHLVALLSLVMILVMVVCFAVGALLLYCLAMLQHRHLWLKSTLIFGWFSNNTHRIIVFMNYVLTMHNSLQYCEMMLQQCTWLGCSGGCHFFVLLR